MPASTTNTILPRVNIETSLPKNVRKLRFNQNLVAEKFGTFKQFLVKYEDKISRKKRPEIQRIIKEYYDKYGSSDEEEDDATQNNKRKSISISLSRDED